MAKLQVRCLRRHLCFGLMLLAYMQVQDLAKLPELTDNSIAKALKARYEQQDIHVGHEWSLVPMPVTMAGIL